MRDTLELALTDIVSPEQLFVLSEATGQLETCGLSAPSDDLQMVIEMADAMCDNALLVSRVNDVLYKAYEEAFASLGVQVIDETPLAFKTALLDTLTSMDYYILPEQVQMLYQAPFTNEEIVAHLVPIFSTYDLESSVEYLEQVSDATILRLKSLIEAKLAQADPDGLLSPKDNTARVARLNKLIKAVTPAKVSVVYELAHAGVRAGRPFDALLEQNFERFESFEPEHLTAELLALILFSDVPLDQVKHVTRALISEFKEEHHAIQRMEAELDRLVTTFEP